MMLLWVDDAVCIDAGFCQRAPNACDCGMPEFLVDDASEANNDGADKARKGDAMGALTTERKTVDAGSPEHRDSQEDGWITAYTEDGTAYMLRQRDGSGKVVSGR